MLARRISLVAREAVPRIQGVQLRHQAIAVHLRDDRCGRDREIDAVTLVEAVLRLEDAGNRAAVHQNMLRYDLQIAERELHRPQTGVVDVKPVDLFDIDDTDTDGDGLVADLAIEPAATFLVERLRVVDPLDFRIRGKDHRSRDYGPGERPDTYLIDPRDMYDAGFPQQTLKVQHRIEAQPFSLLLLEPLQQRLVELAHAVAGVPLQLAQHLGRHGSRRIGVFFVQLLERNRRGVGHDLFSKIFVG